MSNREDYESKLASAVAIPGDQIVNPGNIPMEIYVQEAETLFQFCQKDKDALLGKGLDENYITDLPIRCGALREAESQWTAERFTKEEAEKKWKKESPIACDFRDDLLDDFRYAYRKHPDVLGRVRAIADGSGAPDMIQDLSDLSVLGKKYPDQLTAIKFEIADLDKAAAMSDELAALYGKARVDQSENSKTMDLRNRMYTHLKEAVDEVKACGYYTFKKDESKRKCYTSEYLRMVRRRRAKSSDANV